MDKDMINKNKALLQGAVAGLIVFIFALGVFLAIRRLSTGSTEYMPIAQIKQDGEWVVVREPSYDGWYVQEEPVGVDFVVNEEDGTYDMIVHYVQDEELAEANS